MTSLASFVDRMLASRNDVALFASKLTFFVYVSAYDAMVSYLEQALQAVGGIQRENKYQRYGRRLVRLLRKSHALHIRPDDPSPLLNTELVAPKAMFASWLDASYTAVTGRTIYRTAATYKQRIRAWKRIFDRTDAALLTTMQQRSALDTSMFSQRALNPYIFVLNYGGHYMYSRPGYPEYIGIHFIEYGISRIPDFRAKADALFNDTITRWITTGTFTEPAETTNATFMTLFQQWTAVQRKASS